MKELKYLHFNYCGEVIKWANESTVQIVSIINAGGGFLDGITVFYYSL